MKKRLFFLSVGLTLMLGGLAWTLAARDAATPAPAKDDAPPKTAASRIVQVTVYPDSALVTREVDVPAGQGSMELVVNPLPEHTINSSLYSENVEGIRVLTTRFRTRPVKEDTREDVRKLEDDARTTKMDIERQTAELNAIKENMALLGKLEGFTTVSTQHATQNGKLDSKEITELTKYVMDGRAEKSREVVKLQQQIQTNQEHLEFIGRKLKEMTAGTSRFERDAVIVVDKAKAVAGKVRLNYLVDSAAWRPQYKLRAGKTNKDAVQLEYLAAIMQQTGEDWRGVDLVLSTAQPLLNAAPPELKMLAVNVVPRGTPVAATKPMEIPPMPKFSSGGGSNSAPYFNQAKMPQGLGRPEVKKTSERLQLGAISNPSGSQTATQLGQQAKELREYAQKDAIVNRDEKDNAEIFNYAGALEQARDLTLSFEEKGVASIKGIARAAKNEGPSVTYHLNARLTVPSRNDEQVIEVARLDMAPEYYYKAVPVLTPHVYRQADLTNKSKYVLLPGEATMYNGSDFVGRMNLPLVAIGETFTVGFGAEPQLQVQRQMMDKSRTMQGGNQILKFEYRILVSSYKPEKVRVQLWDRLPMAEGETMNVTLGKTTPEVCKEALYVREDKPHNLLRWDLDVEPDMNGERAREVNYEFKLELDKQMSIGSFQSK